jgi:hypothetical protein
MPTPKKSPATASAQPAKKEKEVQPSPWAELEKAVRDEGEKRRIMNDFVTSQLKEDVDYGSIRIAGRQGKPTLFKPGMEKIFSLFSIVSHLEKDEETLSMITTKDVIAYKCKLYRNGQFLGEGRGACTVSEKGRVNDAIKIAEKRARMDACLNLGFSEYFTQDLEDWKDDQPVSAAPEADSSPGRERTPRSSLETLEFTVEEKEELTSQSGNPYARLRTNRGSVIAFRNTMDKFQAGSTYLAGGMWEEKNGNAAFLVTGPSSGVVESTAIADSEQQRAS